MIILIQEIIPTSEFLIYTSVSSPLSQIEESKQTVNAYLSPLYRHRNVTVIVDEENSLWATHDAVRSFAMFASADILLTAWSSLSRVASIFNPNCVIHQAFPDSYLFHWSHLILPSSLEVRWNESERNSSSYIKERERVREETKKCLSQRLPRKMETQCSEGDMPFRGRGEGREGRGI
jgi:hypothetical protein